MPDFVGVGTTKVLASLCINAADQHLFIRFMELILTLHATFQYSS